MQKLKEEKPLVSIIIPTRNSEATIEKCLISIKKQSYDNMEVIVVDNYSSDRTRQIAKKYDAKIYLKGPERSAQVNFGAEKAGGKYIYRVDSDFVLQPDVVREAVESCEKRGYDAIIIHNTSDPTISFWAKVRKVERDCYKNDELNVAARFWRKEAFRAVSGFDESLIAADDYDLHGRLEKEGFKVGRIMAEEVHEGEPRTLIEIVQKHYYYGKSVWRFIAKNPKKAARQLSPVRISHIRSFSQFLGHPKLLLGFTIYQFARYMATAIGIIAARLEAS